VFIFSKQGDRTTGQLQAGDPFWKAISLEELIKQQGVSAASDLDEISSLWPADDDPDKLLHHVLHERAQRRLAKGEMADGN